MSKIAEAAYGDTPAPYPRSPGYKEPTTSKEAAAKFKSFASTLREQVLNAIAGCPEGLTADEVAAQLNQSVLAVRPRVAELHHAKKIKRSGIRRANASGMKAHVWIRNDQ